ncbi:MAG: hypothetical protein ABEJ64_02515 [Candidatus Nanohaloarchaea archaeon]
MSERCDYCSEEFSSEKDRLEHELDEHADDMSGHEKDDKKNRLNKLQEKDRVASLKKKQKLKTGAAAAVLAIGLVAGGFYAYQNTDMFASGPTNSSIGVGEPVHWHAPYTIKVCGDSKTLQGGPILAHTHGETRFHLEGVRTSREQATLDWIIDSLGGEFSNSGILGYEEPESCPGSEEPGNLTVKVNGQEIENPESYVVRDGDRIVITYS